MTDTEDRIVIELITIERITVLNPRVRDRKKFREIVDSIRKVGLKQPIKVSRAKGADGEIAYNLVYGQGRLEAFVALGQKEIPAIVTDLSEDDSLLMGLVENVARRQHRPVEMLRAIGTLHEQGYTDRQIAAKIGYSTDYVVKIRRSWKPARTGCCSPSRPAGCRSRSPWPSRRRTTKICNGCSPRHSRTTI